MHLTEIWDLSTWMTLVLLNNLEGVSLFLLLRYAVSANAVLCFDANA